jgi:hypothetical protein
MARVKYISVKEHDKYNLSDYPNFHASGSIAGMKKLYYGQDALLVRCGAFIYNVTSNSNVYEMAH